MDEQSFESLRRLLALKRHEAPPPGYFNNFSRQVMVRIRSGEAQEAATWFDRISGLLKWLERFENKPVFAGGFATGLCLLLIFGAVMAQRPEAASQAFLQPASRDAAPFAAPATAPDQMQASLSPSPNQIMIADNSTNPIIDFQNASMPIGQMPVAQLASFPTSGN